MRNLRKNKQTLYYALYLGEEPRYKLDEEGNSIISYIDKTTTPPTYYYEEDGVESIYDDYVKFKGNIVMSGGDSQSVDYGVSVAEYEAVLITEKDMLPITETSLIWYKSEPTIGANKHTDYSTADYKVIKVSKSLNEDRYILAKIVK